MIGVALKGLLGRKLRAILTAFAIVLGVAMISGAFVLTDTLGKGFDGIYDESYASADAVISSKIATSTDDGGEEAPAFSANVLDSVEQLPGVRVAQGSVEDEISLTDKAGKPFSSDGIALGVAADADQSVNPLQVVTGDWPRGDGQIAIDKSTAEAQQLQGRSEGRRLRGGPVQKYEISGIVRFGSVDSLAGASISVRHGAWRLDWPRLAQSRFPSKNHWPHDPSAADCRWTQPQRASGTLRLVNSMAKVPHICVVGSANVDLTFCTPPLPRAGETLAGHALHIGMGGKGANRAVAAARLGAEVAFVACVGQDSFGTEAINRYQAEGIDTSFVRQDPGRPTGTAAIVLDDEAENCIIVVARANAGLTPEDVRKASSAIQRADAVLCQLETPLDATLEAFRLARAAGKLTVLNPAPIAELPDDLLHRCELCVLNRTEMEFLAKRPVDSPDDAYAEAKLLQRR